MINIKKIKEFYNLKEGLSFVKGRFFLSLFGNSLVFLWCDILDWKYLYFFVWFVPINWILNFTINKLVFKKKLKRGYN